MARDGSAPRSRTGPLPFSPAQSVQEVHLGVVFSMATPSLHRQKASTHSQTILHATHHNTGHDSMEESPEKYCPSPSDLHSDIENKNNPARKAFSLGMAGVCNRQDSLSENNPKDDDSSTVHHMPQVVAGVAPQH